MWVWFLQKKQDEIAFARGWGRCRDAKVRGLPAWEAEAVIILYALLLKGVGVLLLFHQSHLFPSGTRWGRFMGVRSGGSVVFGNLLIDACKVIRFLTTSTRLAWGWAYITVLLLLGATEKGRSVGEGSRSWSARRFLDQFVRCRGIGSEIVLLWFTLFSQKLVCILCRLKRYNLIQHEDWGEKGILRFSLAISVKYIFSEATEGFVETEEKLTPHKFYRVHTKQSSPDGSMYSGFLRWNGGFVCLWHFCLEVVAVLHQTTYTSVMFFDFLKPNPKCKSSHSVAGIANSKALLATM